MFHNQFSDRQGKTDEFLTRTLLGGVAALVVVCLTVWTTESVSPDQQQLAQAPAAVQPNMVFEPQLVSQLEPVLP